MAAPESSATTLGYQSPFGNADAPIWSNGKRVLAFDGSVFPARCFKCNDAAGLTSAQRKLTWSPPLMYLLLIFPGILIGALILILTQKKATVTFAICKKCNSARWKKIGIAWAIFIASVAIFAAAIMMGSGLLSILGVLVFLASLFYAVIATPLCSAAKIKDRLVTLRGAGPEFLNSLELKQS